MNRFSDAGSTPAVSSPEGRAAKLGLLEVENMAIPQQGRLSGVVGFLFYRISAAVYKVCGICYTYLIKNDRTGEKL